MASLNCCCAAALAASTAICWFTICMVWLALSDEESEDALDDPEPLETKSLAHPTMSVRLRTSERIRIKFFILGLDVSPVKRVQRQIESDEEKSVTNSRVRLSSRSSLGALSKDPLAACKGSRKAVI